MFASSLLRGAVCLASIILLTACGGGGGSSPGGGTTPSQPATSGAPVIQSFSGAPSTILPGQSATLSWQVSGAASVSINPGVGQMAAAPVTVSPIATTTYTLSASNAAGNASATTTITVGANTVQYGSMASADLGVGANLNGGIPFPADNPWNTDISGAPVDPSSVNLIASIGAAKGLHPDFGSGLYSGAPIGIPYMVVSATRPGVAITFTAYGSESDPGPYPVPPNAPIEGQQADGSAFGGDRHVIVINRDSNRLYEMFGAAPQPNASWNADSGAIFFLSSNNVRPTAQPGWTSADAAGLPIFPGLARYEEAASGAIRHALRFTVNLSRHAYVPPATHLASSSTDPNRPPMGMRVRLKAGYAIPASFSPEVKAILQALKTYGMFVADNGSDWFISGAPDDRWNNDKLVNELAQVKGSNFEVVRMDGLVTN